ncbi:exodeoxyribonuclease VII small subunit [Halanaerobacter jeridensis]|uniref:Exodeoxyribonuclease 7 small subunit n=1 Tax=Halanaerobacter jeridensis TaxID=706427 RepID=A0A938XU13_9FIRM|nr:exodeoxyribonuclease VII small subunit [Halanaerobacter jeridensis]MBM7555240.1 exodeoxyribonuclease VII small subunit [Halanaerobacter jeridensis]
MEEQELSFEEAISQLEEIIENLEDKDISLDEALQKYQQGVKLSKFCSNKLEQAEEKIEIIRDEEGTIELENYTEEGSL